MVWATSASKEGVDQELCSFRAEVGVGQQPLKAGTSSLGLGAPGQHQQPWAHGPVAAWGAGAPPLRVNGKNFLS